MLRPWEHSVGWPKTLGESRPVRFWSLFFFRMIQWGWRKHKNTHFAPGKLDKFSLLESIWPKAGHFTDPGSLTCSLIWQPSASVRVQSCQYLERQDNISFKKTHKTFLTLPHLTSLTYPLHSGRTHTLSPPSTHASSRPSARRGQNPRPQTAQESWDLGWVLLRLARGHSGWSCCVSCCFLVLLILIWLWCGGYWNKQLKMNLLHSYLLGVPQLGSFVFKLCNRGKIRRLAWEIHSIGIMYRRRMFDVHKVSWEMTGCFPFYLCRSLKVLILHFFPTAWSVSQHISDNHQTFDHLMTPDKMHSCKSI